MFYRVQSVQPLSNLSLMVTFVNGGIKRYDVLPWLSRVPAFKHLQSDTGLFDSVKVDIGGYGISWNDDLDLSCNELWHAGTAWDPDYTKLTPAEAASLEAAEAQEAVPMSEIDWD